MNELPLAPVKRIIKKSGASRVSEEAVEQLRDEVEQFAEERADEANMLAEHAGRKTVKAEDLLASE